MMFTLTLPVLLFLCMTSFSTVTSQDVCDMRAVLSRLNALEAENHLIREQNHALQEQITKLQGKSDTLFLATLSAWEEDISDREIIEWNHAIHNPGGHFDTRSGTYNVPYHGYYQFSVMKRGNNNYGQFWLLVNDKRYYFVDMWDPDDERKSGTATINLELKYRDIVRVENDHSTEIYGTEPTGSPAGGAGSPGSIHSWFTGFMIFSLE